MNVRGGRNLFGKAADKEIQKRKFREVPYSYSEHEEAEAIIPKPSKASALQKAHRFDEFDASGRSQSGLVTYPTVHINKNYGKYLRQTGKTGEDAKNSSSRRDRSDSSQRSRSLSAVSFKIKSTEASVKLQNKTESFEILKSAYEDDDDDEFVENFNDEKGNLSSRNRGGDENPEFKVPKAPTPPCSDPKVEQFAKLDPDTFDKISELLAQKEFIEKQLKSIAEHGDDEMPSETIQKEMYDSARKKHKNHHERADWDDKIREDKHYERVKEREKTWSTGGTIRSHNDLYRSDREAERYYDQHRSDALYPSVADRHRIDYTQVRSASDMDPLGMTPGYYSGYMNESVVGRENKDLLTLEREYQEFSETVGVHESSFSAPSNRGILTKSAETTYYTDNSSSYNKQNIQPGSQNFNPAIITGQGLLPTPGLTEGQSTLSYPIPSGQTLLSKQETGHGLLPTPTPGVNLKQQYQGSMNRQGLLPTPAERGIGNPNEEVIAPVQESSEKPFEAIKKTLNLLNIKLSESNKTKIDDVSRLSGNVHFSGETDTGVSAERQLINVRNQEYDQSRTDIHGNQMKYKRVLPPELKNREQQQTDDYDVCDYDSWRGSGHEKYAEEVSYRSKDHFETDIYNRKDTYSDQQNLKSSQAYDPFHHDPYQHERLDRSQDYNIHSHQHESYPQRNFEGHIDDFESRKRRYDNLDSIKLPSETKTKKPPSLMSLQLSPPKKLGRSSNQSNPDLQTPEMSKDQRCKENPSYQQSDDFDSDYNPYLDGDQDDEEYDQELQPTANEYFDEDNENFRNRLTRFSDVEYQHQGRDYPMDDISAEPLSVGSDRNKRLTLGERRQNYEIGRDFNKYGRSRSATVTGSEYPDEKPAAYKNKKRRSRFDPVGDDYGYSDQQNQTRDYRTELGHEEEYAYSYDQTLGVEQNLGLQTSSDYPPDSDSSFLLNVRGALSETVEEANAFPPKSSYDDFDISRSNCPPLSDFPHANFDTNNENSSAMDQPGFVPPSAMSKQPRIPGHQTQMRGMPNSRKPNIPRNENREQNISRPFPPKYQNKEQVNNKPIPLMGREAHMSKPLLPMPAPGREINAHNVKNNSNLTTTTMSAEKRTSDLSAVNATVTKPLETGASRKPDNKEDSQETLSRGKRPANQIAKDEESPAAKQKKGGCINCGSLDHIKCPKARKIQTEGTPKYGEQHGLPNIPKPGQKKEISLQNKGTGKINIPAKEDKEQDKNVQQHPEASKRCIDDLRNYLQNYLKNISPDDPVSALTSAMKAYSVIYSFKETILKTEGEPDKFSGALYVKQSIYLARGICDNKDTLKPTVFKNAVENLLKMSTLEILNQKDHGFPFRMFDEEEDLRKPWPESGMKCEVENCNTPIIETYKKYIDHWHKFHEPYISFYTCLYCKLKLTHRWELTRHLKRKHKMEDEISKDISWSVPTIKLENKRYIPPNGVIPPKKAQTDDNKSDDKTDDIQGEKIDDVKINEGDKTDDIKVNERGKMDETTSKKKDKADVITTNKKEKIQSDNIKDSEAEKNDDITNCKKVSSGDIKAKKRNKTDDITAKKRNKTDDITAKKRIKTDDITGNKRDNIDDITANNTTKKPDDSTTDKKDNASDITENKMVKTDNITENKMVKTDDITANKTDKSNENTESKIDNSNVKVKTSKAYHTANPGKETDKSNQTQETSIELIKSDKKNEGTEKASNSNKQNVVTKETNNSIQGNITKRGEQRGNLAPRRAHRNRGNMVSRGALNPPRENMVTRGAINQHRGNIATRGVLNPFRGNAVARGALNMQRGNLASRGAFNQQRGNMASRGAFNQQRGNMASRGAFNQQRGNMVSKGEFSVRRGNMVMRGAFNSNRMEETHPFFSR